MNTAIIYTGAAARIAQETALTNILDEQGELKNVKFLSGCSSGGLNVILTNAVLQEDKDFSWPDVQDILFSLKNEDVFKRENGLPLNTKPLRKTLKRLLTENIGYESLEELPFASSISSVIFNMVPFIRKTIRFNNFHSIYSKIDLLDILMATTAIPAIFPPQKIKIDGLFSDINIPIGRFYDGGVLEDSVPFRSLPDWLKETKTPIDKIFVISPLRNENKEKELNIQNIDLQRELNDWALHVVHRNLIKRLKQIYKNYSELRDKVYVYSPKIKCDYPLLEFSTQKDQYEQVYDWGKENDPKSLKQVLSENTI